jgi:hypothetical protein
MHSCLYITQHTLTQRVITVKDPLSRIMDKIHNGNNSGKNMFPFGKPGRNSNLPEVVNSQRNFDVVAISHI